ncbi:MAG: efflux transporter outer membrane subunit [Chitinophagaceae bacterium]
MKKKYIFFCLVCMLFSVFWIGCITPPYTRSNNLPIDRLVRADSVKIDTSKSLASISWRDFYADTNLQKLIAEAIDSNVDIRLSINRLDQQTQYLKQSNSAFFPSVNIGWQSTANGYAGATVQGLVFGNEIISQHQFGLSASCEIDIWGKLRSAKKSQQALMMQQQSTMHATYVQLIANVASMYYQLIILDNQKKITLDNIFSYNHYLETVQSLKQAAQANEVAVLQAKAQLANANAYLPQIEASIAMYENSISNLLGKIPSPIVRSVHIDVTKLFYDSLSVGIPIQLLSNRPDVQAAEYALISSHELFNAAKASMYPQLVLSGNIGFQARDIAQVFSLPGAFFWNVLGGLTQPLFNARQLKTQKEITRLQESASFISFKQTLLNAGNEVSTILSNIHFYTKQSEYQREQVENLQKAYEYSQELLIDGYATYLDVLSAQSNVLSSVLNLYNTYNMIIQQKITLYRALGGGWK